MDIVKAVRDARCRLRGWSFGFLNQQLDGVGPKYTKSERGRYMKRPSGEERRNRGLDHSGRHEQGRQAIGLCRYYSKAGEFESRQNQVQHCGGDMHKTILAVCLRNSTRIGLNRAREVQDQGALPQANKPDPKQVHIGSTHESASSKCSQADVCRACFCDLSKQRDGGE